MKRTKPKNGKDALEVPTGHLAAFVLVLEAIAFGQIFVPSGDQNNHLSCQNVLIATGSKAQRCSPTWNCAS